MNEDFPENYENELNDYYNQQNQNPSRFNYPQGHNPKLDGTQKPKSNLFIILIIGALALFLLPSLLGNGETNNNSNTGYTNNGASCPKCDVCTNDCTSVQNQFNQYRTNVSNKISELQEENIKLTTDTFGWKSKYYTKSNQTVIELESCENEKDQEVKKLQKEIEGMTDSKEFVKCQDDLEEKSTTYDRVLEERDQYKEDYDGIKEDYDDLKNDVDNIIEDLDSLLNQIEDSQVWYKENSKITEVDEWDDIYEGINNSYSHSVEGTSTNTEVCIITPHIIYNYMTENEGLDVTQQSDDENNPSLKSLQQFIDDKGGDCEDYSLFFKAILNYTVSYCLEESADSIDVWRYRLKSDYHESEGYPTGTYYNVEGFWYPTMICGHFRNTDDNDMDTEGHCVVALTKNEIRDVNDVADEIDGALIIESTSGKFLGFVDDRNDDWFDTYIKDEDVTDVITIDNHYANVDRAGWRSIDEFEDDLMNYIDRLEEYDSY